jgi:hypothetical protein
LECIVSSKEKTCEYYVVIRMAMYYDFMSGKPKIPWDNVSDCVTLWTNMFPCFEECRKETNDDAYEKYRDCEFSCSSGSIRLLIGAIAMIVLVFII